MNVHKVYARNLAKKVKYSLLKKRFEQILKTLREDPSALTDSFEKLQPYEDQKYSRRLNIHCRVVYTVDAHGKGVYICSAWSHYD
ncbi:Txe/YoeB family addiction module toxin [Enterococcus rivorum]|uniref:Txe/YoeB family addiction module toxin n=1 Tax=Enterococcus rivorum TaxID=762845 RepID=UPI000A04CAD9|nr:Txe/YoeB family addiction module toxin [Enterococcus rivorum]